MQDHSIAGCRQNVDPPYGPLHKTLMDPPCGPPLWTPSNFLENFRDGSSHHFLTFLKFSAISNDFSDFFTFLIFSVTSHHSHFTSHHISSLRELGVNYYCSVLLCYSFRHTEDYNDVIHTVHPVHGHKRTHHTDTHIHRPPNTHTHTHTHIHTHTHNINQH